MRKIQIIACGLFALAISSCSVAGDVAMVRIESKFGETDFSDMFTLVKDGSDWKIVSKVYHNK